MVNCFLCLVNLTKKCGTFNILRSHGTVSKTSYGDLIGKLLNDQKLVITIDDDSCICETCNTLINGFDRTIYEQNVITQIVTRQVSSNYLKSKGISLPVDDEALATFDKRSGFYQCKQCGSYKTNQIEFIAAHFKAHQCKLNESKTVVKNEINDDNVDDQEMPIEEVLLNSSCKYEIVADENEATSSEQVNQRAGVAECVDAEREAAKQKRTYRLPNDSVADYTTSTRLPKYLNDIIKITNTRSTDIPTCQTDNLFVIEVPEIETVDYHFTCKICLRKFLDPVKLASHLLTHKDIKYSCKHCIFTVSNVLFYSAITSNVVN